MVLVLTPALASVGLAVGMFQASYSTTARTRRSGVTSARLQRSNVATRSSRACEELLKSRCVDLSMSRMFE